MLDCDEPEGLVPYLYVVVRQDGGEWHPAVTERSVADRRITVKTLMPGKNYEIAVYSDEKKCNTFMITTESALSLPNPDFEDYHNSISMKNVNCGGKYSNVATMIAVYNKADIYADEPDAVVARRTCAAVRLVYRADAVGMPRGIVVADLAAAVGRAVVDQQQLKVLTGLRQDGVDALGQIFLDAVDRDDQAEFRHGVFSFVQTDFGRRPIHLL